MNAMVQCVNTKGPASVARAPATHLTARPLGSTVLRSPRTRRDVAVGAQVGIDQLEMAVRAINKMLKVHEQSSKREAAIRPRKAAASGSVAGAVRTKHVTCEASAKHTSPVRENTSAGRGIRHYLALPVEDYALLDPTLVQRNESGSGNEFTIRLPLQPLLGIDLTPRVDVRVDRDVMNRKVCFLAERLVVGDLQFDRDVRLRLASSLRAGPSQIHDDDADCHVAAAQSRAWHETLTSWLRPQQPPASQQVHMHAPVPDSVQAAAPVVVAGALPVSAVVPVATKLGREAASGAALHTAYSASTAGKLQLGDEDATSPLAVQASPVEAAVQLPVTSDLQCSVELSVRVELPPSMASLPAGLLSASGSLLLRFVLQQVLPTFLQLLLEDYSRWAAGDAAARATAVGNLVPVPPAAQLPARAHSGTAPDVDEAVPAAPAVPAAVPAAVAVHAEAVPASAPVDVALNGHVALAPAPASQQAAAAPEDRLA